MQSGQIQIELQQSIEVRRWGADEVGAPGGAEIHRGLLTFALRPASNVTEKLLSGTIKSRSVQTVGPRNFALDLDSLKFESGDGVPEMPFSSEQRPAVRILAVGR